LNTTGHILLYDTAIWFEKCRGHISKSDDNHFCDFLYNLVECYVDDLVVKIKDRENHSHDLRKVFKKLLLHQLKMNPLKCTFRVTSGKFLGFIVRKEGIEIDSDEIKAII